MTEPETKTSGAGRQYLKFAIVVDPANGTPATWWNAVAMQPLVDAAGAGFFSKKRYAKFTGLGTPNKSWKNKEGKEGTSNEILVTAIELQDGSFIKGAKEEEIPF